MQGNRKKQQQVDRRRAFANAAALSAQQPVGPPLAPQVARQSGMPQPAAVSSQPAPESRPGFQQPVPRAEVQLHQQVVRSSIGPANSPTFAPYSGQPGLVVSRPPVEDRELRRPVLEETRVEDVTVILYSGGATSNLLASQLEALRQQSVHPRYIWIHVDGSAGHDERTLASMHAWRTPIRVGRNHRLMLARHAETTFVAILDEDTIPGRRWLERSVLALKSADPQGELVYGAALLASSGVLVDSDGRTRPVGPEFPRDEPAEVDYGRQAWFFRSELSDHLDSVPVAGSTPGSFGLRLAAGAQSLGVPTVVLDYGLNHDDWLSRQPTQLLDDAEELMGAFQGYLELGWRPMSYQATPAPQAGYASTSSQGQSQSFGAGETGRAASITQPDTQPDDYPAHLADMGLRPGDLVRSAGHDGLTVIERVLSDQTVKSIESPHARELMAHEASPPPLHASTERLLPAPSNPPAYQSTEHLVRSSPPPASAGTERIVGAAPPPANAATETIVERQ